MIVESADSLRNTNLIKITASCEESFINTS